MRTVLRRADRLAAFTLLEIMLVVAIIMLLLGAGAFYIAGYFDNAKRAVAFKDVNAYGTALQTYYMTNGFYPSTTQGLNALVTAPNGEPKPRRWTQLMESVTKDPWNNDYIYAVPGKRSPKGFDLYSKGPDGIDGSEDDLGNHNLSK